MRKTVVSAGMAVLLGAALAVPAYASEAATTIKDTLASLSTSDVFTPVDAAATDDDADTDGAATDDADATDGAATTDDDAATTDDDAATTDAAAATDIASAASGSIVTLSGQEGLQSDSYASWDFLSEVGEYLVESSSAGDFLLSSQGETISGPYGYLVYIYDHSGDLGHSSMYFQAQMESGINVCAAIDGTGQQITNYAYADFESYGEHWLAGIVVTQVEESVTHEYVSDGNYYAIDTVDLYYDGTKVATLDRASYDDDNVGLIDGYLAVQMRDQDVWNVYDGSGQIVNTRNTSWWSEDDALYTDDSGVMRHVSGAQVGTADCTLSYEDLEQPFYVGDEGNVIYDIYGAQVATLDFEVVRLEPFNNGYAVVRGVNPTSGEYKYGVFDENWNLVIPLEYDTIGAGYTNMAFTQGYCYVEQDGKFGYLAQDGTLAVPVQYAVSAQKFQGDLYCVIQDIDGTYRIVSAVDGLEDTGYSDVYTANTGTFSPLALVANADGLWGLVDFQGNVLVDFAYEYSYYITPNDLGTMALVEGTDNSSVTIMHFDNALMPGEEAAATTAVESGPVVSAAEEADATEPAATEEAAATEPVATTDETATQNVVYAGVSIDLPSDYALAGQGDNFVYYVNPEDTVAVGIWDYSTTAIPEGTTDYNALFRSSLEQSVAQYGEYEIEDLGSELGIDYSYGVTLTSSDGAMILVAMYVTQQEGFSYVQYSYDPNNATDADVDELIEIINATVITGVMK